MSDTYLKRIVDSYINDYMEHVGALLIEGPKWCGKTRTAEEHSRSSIHIISKNQIESLRLAAESGSVAFLEGETPRLIDEWQDVPEIWNAVRFEVDRRRKNGQFILTGSSVPPEDPSRHSGAGRIARMNMRTMSCFESGDSNGSVSLRSILASEAVDGYSDLKTEQLADILLRGGWPQMVSDKHSKPNRIVKDYLRSVISSDLSRVDGVRKDPSVATRIIESIARNTSTSASLRSIMRDAGETNDETVKRYVEAMERIFLTENLRAWNPHLRSRTRLITTPKWHFTDPSLAAGALNITRNSLLKDYNTLGLLFESMCLRDLRVYSQPLGGEVYFLRNKNGFEVDFVLEFPDGNWGAVEAKLSGREADAAAGNLLKLKEMVDIEKTGEPSFLMVLVSTGPSYRRPDGVYVVSIGCLRD